MSATGGNGSYVFTAAGASSAQLVDNNKAVSVVYNSTGAKTVVVTSGGAQVTCNVTVNQPQPSTTTLAVNKLVRNVTQNGTFAENLSGVRAGDVLEYQIRIRNTGSIAATSVALNDFVNQAGILTDFRSLNASVPFSGQLTSGGINFGGTLAAGQEITVYYSYTAATSLQSAVTVCNTATASGANAASISDTACMTSSTGAVNLSLSKTAYNNTKGVDATVNPASREDFITYTLTVRNTGNADALNYVISDDLSGILPLADTADLGGGTLNGKVLSYPAMTIPANGTVSKTFQVRVKYYLSASISYQMINTFGNTVTVLINPPTPYTPPKTGGANDLLGGIGFAGLLTAVAAVARRKYMLAA